jgi:hypothetical protein
MSGNLRLISERHGVRATDHGRSQEQAGSKTLGAVCERCSWAAAAMVLKMVLKMVLAWAEAEFR